MAWKTNYKRDAPQTMPMEKNINVTYSNLKKTSSIILYQFYLY